MSATSYSRQAITECICEMVGGGLLLWMACSGGCLNYTAPRLRPFLFIGSAILLLMGGFTVPQIKRMQHRNHTAHCLLLMIPILLLLLPHSTTQSVSPSVARTSIPQTSHIYTTAASSTTTQLAGLDTAHRRITISNQDFFPWLLELNDQLNHYAGYTVTVTGYVLKNSSGIGTGEFVPARLAMTCCTADLTPMGLLCKYAKASALKENTWVTVEGTLCKGTYQGSPDPELLVTRVKPAQAVSGYIYPYQS